LIAELTGSARCHGRLGRWSHVVDMDMFGLQLLRFGRDRCGVKIVGRRRRESVVLGNEFVVTTILFVMLPHPLVLGSAQLMNAMVFISFFLQIVVALRLCLPCSHLFLTHE
jgi:hypothetical protein